MQLFHIRILKIPFLPPSWILRYSVQSRAPETTSSECISIDNEITTSLPGRRGTETRHSTRRAFGMRVCLPFPCTYPRAFRAARKECKIISAWNSGAPVPYKKNTKARTIFLASVLIDVFDCLSIKKDAHWNNYFYMYKPIWKSKCDFLHSRFMMSIDFYVYIYYL